MEEITNDQRLKHSFSQIVSLLLLAIFLIGIPVFVFIMGKQTRSQIKANEECRKPTLPNPSECVGGEWRLRENATGCLRFYCLP
jgi:hypothetical protein